MINYKMSKLLNFSWETHYSANCLPLRRGLPPPSGDFLYCLYKCYVFYKQQKLMFFVFFLDMPASPHFQQAAGRPRN